LEQVIGASIAAHAPFLTTIILPSFIVINPSFNAAVVAAAEVSAVAGAGAGVTAAVSVEVVDDLEPSLHAHVKPAIAAINNNFFMVFFLVLIVRKSMPIIHSY
jgi:hypothetical protein